MYFFRSIILFLLFSHLLSGQSIVEISSNKVDIKLGRSSYYYLDTAKVHATQTQIQKLYEQNQLPISKKTYPNFGLLKGKNVWFVFTLQNRLSEPKELVLEVAYPMIDSACLYAPDSNGYKIECAGSKVMHSSWSYKNKKVAIPLFLLANEQKTYYLKINDTESLYVDLGLSSEDVFAANDDINQLFNGFVFGILFLSIIFSIVLYLGNKDFNQLVFAANNLGVVLILLVVDGFLYYYLWPETPYLNDVSFRVVIFATNIAGEEFTRRFLILHKEAPTANAILKAFQVLSGIAVIFALFGRVDIAAYFSIIMLIGPFIETFGAIKAYRNGYTPASKFLISRLPFFIITLSFAMIEINIIPYWGPLFQNIFASGAIFQVILISLTLSEKDYKARLSKIEIEREHEILKNKELSESNRFKNEILSITSHDLKGPLSNIKTLASFIADNKYDNHEELIQYSKLIRDTANNLNILVKNLLDNAALDLGKFELDIKPTELSEMVNDLVKQQKYVAALKDQKLLVYYDLLTNYVAFVDELRLKQALENLVSNALKFTPQGGTITIAVTKNATHTRVEVKDQGPGLTDEDKKHLFKEFKKLSARPTGKESSTGLGLTIVKKIIDLHNGKVWAESIYGQGSSFIIEVPNKAGVKLSVK